MLEDKLLIWKLNRGSTEVLAVIYEKYKHDLVTLATGLLTNVSAAEDVVHDVFVSFIKSAGRFRLTGSLKGYLAACVANAARNKNKATHRRRSTNIEQTDLSSPASASPDDCAIRGEQQRRVISALAQLPYEQREALVLHIYGGMKFRAIAQQQDVSTNTVQGRYRYALDRLRSLLNREVIQ
jgi:RNA polymerase sigma-70 factor (ECF subfamily)